MLSRGVLHNQGVNIQLLSDLHLESNPHFSPQPVPGADLLVLAGDIGSYQPGSLLSGTDFGLARFSPLPVSEGGAGWPTPVLFLPGNHEYDGLDFELTHARLRETCERLGLIWLEREVLVLQGIRFVGTTLWADFDALTAMEAAQGQVTIGEQLKAREKAFRAANFYLKKNHSLRAGQPMLAEALRDTALQSQAWLRQALAVPFEGPTVVVTHHPASPLAADAFRDELGVPWWMPAFYASTALEDLAEADRPDLWISGHFHAAHDMTLGRTRWVANPVEGATYSGERIVEVG